MSKTVVGLFSTVAEAQQVKQKLVSQGYESKHITVVANDDDNGFDATNATGTTKGTGNRDNVGVGQKISNFFHGLTGGDKDVHHHYATGVNSGGALLAVTCSDEDASRTANMLMEHGAREIEGSSASRSGSDGYGYGESTRATTAGETSIPVVEEELVVGKREVDRGGVRVYSHVSERPVSADVTLREEHINVQRRPVDRAATAADFEAGQGSMFELNATGEEAVVGKNARVVEEVLVGKNSSEHTEAIHDSVRRTEVDVEEVGAGKASARDRY